MHAEEGVVVKVLAVIPARYGSTRFEGKPLALICGRPMIQHVYEHVRECSLINRVIVATDSEAIAKTVHGFGGETCMTSPSHASGTDRVAEVAQRYDADIVVNVQGDEPLLPARALAEALQPMLENASLPMATLKTKIENHTDLNNPNVVKVVTDQNGFALYFSRSAIPFGFDAVRDRIWFRHIGLYVYTRPFLMTFAQLPQTMLEKVERLEQLRVLEHGYRMQVVETTYNPVGVDIPDDIIRVERILAGR